MRTKMFRDDEQKEVVETPQTETPETTEAETVPANTDATPAQ